MPKLNAGPPLLTLIGIIPFSTWWIAQMLLLEHTAGPAIGEFSLAVLRTVVMAQVLGLCLFVPGWLAEAPTTTTSVALGSVSIVLPAVVPAWPLIAVLGLASGAGAGQLVLAQLAVITAGTLAVFASGLLRRLPDAGQPLAGRCLGLTLAAVAWYTGDAWLTGFAS